MKNLISKITFGIAVLAASATTVYAAGCACGACSCATCHCG